MTTSCPSLQISFQGTTMFVSKLRERGELIYNISFADGRRSETIIRRKDLAGYYWVPLSSTNCRMAGLLGKRIIQYATAMARRVNKRP